MARTAQTHLPRCGTGPGPRSGTAVAGLRFSAKGVAHPSVGLPCGGCGPLCVIGVGNRERGDDAVGILVAEALLGWSAEGLRILTLPGSAAELIGAWEGARQVLLVDAVVSGARPGSIHRLDGHDPAARAILAREPAASTHGLGLVEALALAEALGSLPERVRIWGIEGAAFEPGAALSTPVAHALPLVVAELGCWLAEHRRS